MTDIFDGSMTQTLIKAEEMFLKKQILSLNDQFQDLLSSVAKLYPDILNEDFAKKPDKNVLQFIEYNDSLHKADKRSRWNEWRDGKTKRMSFTGGERNLTKPDDTRRPSSLHVGDLNGRRYYEEQGSQNQTDDTRRPSSLHVGDLNGRRYYEEQGSQNQTHDTRRPSSLHVGDLNGRRYYEEQGSQNQTTDGQRTPRERRSVAGARGNGERDVLFPRRSPPSRADFACYYAGHARCRAPMLLRRPRPMPRAHATTQATPDAARPCYYAGHARCRAPMLLRRPRPMPRAHATTQATPDAARPPLPRQ
ncbi:hypothetical protein QZH41_005529 [Actinostola sp. cb2023]|nr:hypothetical protein QZH41_005529 [Actinostola sp. cb2023]